MIDINEIIVIDDAISPGYQDLLEEWATSPSSKWYFSKDIALPDNVIAEFNLDTRFGFSKPLFNKNHNFSDDQVGVVLPLVYEATHKINYKVQEILFSRSFITTPLPNIGPNDYDHIHVDTPEDHLVVLYYVNDSDGDTVFFDQTLTDILEKQDLQSEKEGHTETFFNKSVLDAIDNVNKEDFKVIKRVTPKKGRVAIFNGLRYHSAIRPSNGHRIVINTCVR